MSRIIEKYLDDVCDHVRCRDVHRDIRAELRTHLEEIVDECKEMGQDLDEAEACAVLRMGDAAIIGRQFDRIHRPKTDWLTIVLMVLFTGCGLVVMASLDQQPGKWMRVTDMLESKLMGVAIGLLVFMVCVRLDYRRLRMWGERIYIGTWLAILPLFWIGVRRAGMLMYDLGVMKLDIIRISPFLFLLAVASMLTRWSWQRDDWKVPLFLWYILPAILYVKLPSQSTFVLYTVGFLTLAAFSGIGFKKLSSIIGIILIAGAGNFFLFADPWTQSRLEAFLHPYQDPLGVGYQTVQSIETIRGAGLWGHGFGTALPYVPEAQAEFVFTYIVHIFGWAGGSAVVLLIGILLVRLYRIAVEVRESFGRMMGTTIVVLFALLFLWNIMMTVGLVPIAGVPLPFIAHGNTSFLLHMAALGLLVGIHRRRDILSRPR